ncbi:MAG TPA: hypothetical protein DHW82_02070, partial [Spirochaetia bacterium]|nr:hypothetical protein [Spirochaetia bacterium]
MKPTYEQLEKRIQELEKQVSVLTETEKKLKKIEEMFHLFMFFSPIYVFFKDKDIRTIALSKNYEIMLGMPIENMIGKTMDDLFPSDLAKSMIEDDKKILREGKPFGVVETLNERTYTTIKFPLKTGSDEPLLAGFTFDITEQKKIEQELETSKNLLRMTIDSIPMWISTMDKNFKYMIANKHYTDTFKIPLDQIEGHRPQEFFPPELFLKHKKLGDECLTGKVVGFEDEAEFEKGKKTYLYGFYTPLYDKENQIWGLTAAVFDITKQKELEVELLTYARKLKESDETKNKFFSIIAHDLRNPFNILLNFTELLLKDLNEIDKKEVEKRIQILHDASRKGFSLLGNLLEWAKSQLNAIEYHPEKLNLFQEVNDCLNLMKYQFEKKEIKVKKDHLKNLWVTADKNLLMTVLRNLFSNAVKYSFKDGVVKVFAEETESE